MKRTLIICIVLASFVLSCLGGTWLAVPANAAERLYMWEDESGAVTLTDRKPDKRSEWAKEAKRREAARRAELRDLIAKRKEEEQARMEAEREARRQMLAEQEAKAEAERLAMEAAMLAQQQEMTPPDPPRRVFLPGQRLRDFLGIQQGQQIDQRAVEQAMLRGAGLTLVIFAFLYIFSTYVLYRIGRKFEVGSFLGYFIPIWNLYLLCKCAGLPGWHTLLYFVPLIGPLHWFYLWGKIAGRLDKNPILWGIIIGFFYLPVLVLAFDSSEPDDMGGPPPAPQGSPLYA
jgi:hypothetical protein